MKIVIDTDKLADVAAEQLDKVVDIPLTPEVAEKPLIKQGVALILCGIAQAAGQLPGEFITVQE